MSTPAQRCDALPGGSDTPRMAVATVLQTHGDSAFSSLPVALQADLARREALAFFQARGWSIIAQFCTVPVLKTRYAFL